MSRTKRVDKNQPEIVKVLRELGFAVVHTHEAGKGYPDLNIGKSGYSVIGEYPELEEFLRERDIPYIENVTILVEVKDEKGKLTPSQERFINEWTGNYIIIRTREDAENLIRRNNN